jgi:type I restriction enzyme, S subunit
MSDELMELPEGWEWTTVRESIEIIDYRGRTPPFSETGIPHLRSSNIKNGTVIWEGLKYVSEETYQEYMTRGLPQKGDVLFTTEAPLGEVALAPDEKFSLAQRMMLLRVCKDLLEPKFLMFQIQNEDFQRKLNVTGTGSTVTGVSSRNFQPLPLALPPLNEQKRIVAKIEALRERSHRAQQALSAVPELCDRFRQSVLAAAFRGDLTADWREQNPDVEWEQTSLGEILKGKPRNGYSPKPVDYITKVKSLTLSATTSGIFKPEFSKYIDEEIDPKSHLWLSPGDILIQRSNTLDYVGTCAIYDGSFGEFIYPDLMMKIQVLESKTTSEFIYYALSTESTRSYFKANATGTAGNMPKINQQVVMGTPILLPGIQEQKEIVQRIQQLCNHIDRFSHHHQDMEDHLDRLNQSILAQAFRGELVDQDPTDEPASILLDRIRAERETQKKPPGKKAKQK